MAVHQENVVFQASGMTIKDSKTITRRDLHPPNLGRGFTLKLDFESRGDFTLKIGQCCSFRAHLDELQLDTGGGYKPLTKFSSREHIQLSMDPDGKLGISVDSGELKQLNLDPNGLEVFLHDPLFVFETSNLRIVTLTISDVPHFESEHTPPPNPLPKKPVPKPVQEKQVFVKKQIALYYPLDDLVNSDKTALDASGINPPHDGTVATYASTYAKQTALAAKRVDPEPTFGACVDIGGKKIFGSLAGIDFSHGLTFEFWMYFGAAGSSKISGTLFTVGGLTLSISAGKLTLAQSARHVQQALPALKNQWVHVAAAVTPAGTAYLHIDATAAAPVKFTKMGTTFASFAISSPSAAIDSWKITHLRIYSTPLNPDQIQQDIVTDRMTAADFRKSYPVSFEVFDDNDNYVMFIDDVGVESNIHLLLKNVSDQALVFKGNTSNPASAANCHFELRFRPGLLSKNTLNMLKGPDLDSHIFKSGETAWTAAANVVEDHPALIYLLYKGPDPSFSANTYYQLILRNMSAAAGFGARGTQVELRLHQLMYQGSQQNVIASRVQHLDIISHRGLQNAPLNAGFVGSNTVLNDGKTPNTLTLRLTNTDFNNPLPFSRDPNKPTTIVLTLKAGDANEEWALAGTSGAASVSGISVSIGKTTVTPTRASADSDSFQCAIKNTAHSPHLIPPALGALGSVKTPDHFDITISKIISGHPSGLTPVAVQFENLPGYWDGQIMCAIEKSPLVRRSVSGENRVGIGTDVPEAKLHVQGTPALTGGLYKSILIDDQEIKMFGGSAVTKQHFSIFNNKLANCLTIDNTSATAVGTAGTHLLAIDKAGKVGIGTSTAPAAALEIDTAVKSSSAEAVGLQLTSTLTAPEGQNAIGLKIAPTYSNPEILDHDPTHIAIDAEGEVLHFHNEHTKNGVTLWMHAQTGPALIALGDTNSEKYGTIWHSAAADKDCALHFSLQDKKIMKLDHSGAVDIIGDLVITDPDDAAAFTTQNAIIHYGNKGKLGQAKSFTPPQSKKKLKGLWIECSENANDSAGIFMSGDTMCLWSPGDNDILRVYDEDTFNSAPALRIGKHKTTYVEKISVGAGTPNAAPLCVNSSGSVDVENYYWLNNKTTGGGKTVDQSASVSIWAEDRMVADEFDAKSDPRLKKFTGVSNSADDLTTLGKLQIKNFTYIDVVNKGTGENKKFDARQVQSVYKQVVKEHTGFIPNIYTHCSDVASASNAVVAAINRPLKLADQMKASELQTITLSKGLSANDLKKGDIVRIISLLGDLTYMVLQISSDTKSFTVQSTEPFSKPADVFIFGKEVDDLLSLDHDGIMALNVSATQALLTRVEALEKKVG